MIKFSATPIEITNVDVSEIDPPMDVAFEGIQKRIPPTAIFCSDADRVVEGFKSLKASVALHLIYKRSWHNSHRIPYPKHLVETYKPWGEVLLAYCELVKELHFLGHGNQYPNGGAWFQAVCLEVGEGDFWAGGGRGKADALKILRGRIKEYRNALHEPFAACNPHGGEEPALAQVFDSIQVISKKGTHKSLLRIKAMAIVKALSQAATALDKGDYRFGTAENGQVLAYISPQERKSLPTKAKKGGKAIVQIHG